MDKSQRDEEVGDLSTLSRSGQATYRSTRHGKIASNYSADESPITTKCILKALEMIQSTHPDQVQARYCYRHRHNTAHTDL